MFYFGIIFNLGFGLEPYNAENLTFGSSKVNEVYCEVM